MAGMSNLPPGILAAELRSASSIDIEIQYFSYDPRSCGRIVIQGQDAGVRDPGGDCQILTHGREPRLTWAEARPPSARTAKAPRTASSRWLRM